MSSGEVLHIDDVGLYFQLLQLFSYSISMQQMGERMP